MIAANGIRGLSRALGLCLALSTASSACFFTDVINEAPVPGIRIRGKLVNGVLQEGGPYYVNDRLVLDATKSSDDDRQGLLAKWQALSCLDNRLPSECVAIAEATESAVETEFSFDVPSHERLEVQLRVTDALGATRQAPDILTIDVSNREPVIDLQVTGYREGGGGPFVLSRAITLIAVPENLDLGLVDVDGDALTLDWQLLPPPGSNPQLGSLSPLGEDGQILVPDVSGTWSVILTASDEFGGSDEIRKDFVVGPDGPPCFQGMDPVPVQEANYLVDSADGARRFSVLSVLDALDPFPAAVDNDPVLGEASFRWLLQEPGSASFVEIPGYTSSSYLVDPQIYSPGDLLSLRVEVRDRVVGPERVLPCAADDGDCELVTGSGCFQRQSWGVQIQ